MRGAARIRRALRRFRGRMGRPGTAPDPAAVLEDGLLESYCRGGRPDVTGLREAFRFFHSPEELDDVAARPEADRGLSEIARRLRGGAQPFFDHELEGPLPPDWLTVPDGGRWTMLPSASYDHVDFVRWGDVRQIWEPARLQAAPALLAAQRLGGDEEMGALAMDLVADFRARNPVGWGPHWIAGLEAGLRVFSLLWSWALHPRLGDEDTLLLAASLLENGRFVESHLSLKEIANNHLIGEAAALYVLGCALPAFTDSARWRDRGRTLLDRELSAQVLADGVQGEQAVEYHRFVLEFYLQARLWGEAAGEDMHAHWQRTLRAMFRPLAALTGPDGLLISLGDDDGGRILRLDDRHRRDARGLLALGCRLLDLEGLGPLAGKVDGEALWLLGPARADLAPDVGELPAVESFPRAGWYSSRFGDRDPATGLPSGHLVFKAGPMGRGSAGHSHADQLSLTLSLGGEPVLVDPGTYLYNGPQEWRDYFRGARAHSLLRVGDRDPARPLPAPDRFGWEEMARAETELALAGNRIRYWQASREGDRDPGGHPLRVGRRVLQIPPGLVLVLDQLPPQGADAEREPEALPLELNWQCAPGVDARWQPAVETEIEGPQGRGSGGHSSVPGIAFHALRLKREEKTTLLAHFFAPEGLFPFHRRGEESPPAGWASSDYARREPAAQTGLAGRAHGSLLIASLFADPRCYPRLERSALELGPGGDFRLEITRELDEIIRASFCRAGGETVPAVGWIEELDIEAPFALAILGPEEQLRFLFAIAARRIRYKGQDLLAEEEAESEIFFEKEW